MKANLKGLDFKQLMIDHGEKLGVGVVALLSVLIVMGMTPWSTYQEKTPEEMIQQVEQQKQALHSSTWPEQEKESFEPRHNISDSAQRMLAGVDVLQFVYPPGFRFDPPLYKYQDPIREPDWLVVEDLQTKYVRIVMEVPPEDETDEDAEGDEPAEDGAEESEVDPRFARRSQRTGGPAGYNLGAMGPGGIAGGTAGTISLGYDPYGMASELEAFGGMTDEYEEYGMEGMDEYGEMGGMARPMIGVEGVRFMAITGVFDYRRQLERIIKSLNDPDRVPQDPNSLLNIIEFDLQRQEMQPGPEPWSDWKSVTVEEAKDVLQRASGFDLDIVEPGITDPAITAPLPLRVMGEWQIEASHPRVKDFELSDDAKLIQEAINRRLAEVEEQQQQLQAAQPTQLKKGGFADLAYNVRQSAQQMYSQYNQGANSMMQMMQMMAPGGAGQYGKLSQNTKAALEQRMQQTISAAGSLLLFRFFDYTVEPGKLYRYRVRLTVENPNRTRSVTDVVDPAVIKGDTRQTQWSNVTEPTPAEPDARYFVDRVNVRKGMLYRPEAGISLYQWIQEFGTLTKGTLDVALGQFIGGKDTTMVVRPEVSLEMEQIEFQTDDMLVDVSDGTYRIDAGEFEDLKLAKPIIELVDQALVVNEYGELLALNPYHNFGERREDEKWVQDLHTAFEDLKPSEQPLEGMEGYEGYEGEMMEMMMEGMEMYGGPTGEGGRRSGRGRSPRSSVRRGGARGGYGR